MVSRAKRIWTTKYVRDTFTVTGFRNWKAAKDNSKGFQQHSSSEMHIEVRDAHAVFIGLKPDLADTLFDSRKKQMMAGRKAMMTLFDAVKRWREMVHHSEVTRPKTVSSVKYYD